MISNRLHTCSSCKAFPLQEAVEAGGRALCGSFSKSESFDNRACVLYERAGDIGARREMVVKLMKEVPDNQDQQERDHGSKI